LTVGPLNRSTQKECRVQVLVRDNNVDQALKVLKKKMQREGMFREMKLRRNLSILISRGKETNWDALSNGE